MIGESSGVTTLINNERISRENQPEPAAKTPDQDDEVASGNFSDITSFSSEALALARKVVPAGGSGADGQVDRQDQGQAQKRMQDQTTGFLDIRV